nr:NADH dehydrogenase subunit 2 [Physella acuta]
MSQISSCLFSSWVLAWMMMELSTVVSLALMMNRLPKKSLNQSSVASYFIFQSFTGLFVLVGGFFVFVQSSNSNFAMMFFVVSLLSKLGVVPFHFWVMGVYTYCSKEGLVPVMLINKFSPLMFLAALPNNCLVDLLLGCVASLSVLVGSMLSLGSNHTQMLLAASSITHTGWLVFGLLTNNLLLYYTCYICSFGIFYFTWVSKKKALTSVTFFSLSGLPPYVLFSPKILIIFALQQNNMVILLVPLVLAIIISLYAYMSMAYYLWFTNMGSVVCDGRSSDEYTNIKVPLFRYNMCLTTKFMTLYHQVFDSLDLKL